MTIHDHSIVFDHSGSPPLTGPNVLARVAGQDYAQRSCPSRRFVRVGPGQLGGYGMMMDPRGMEVGLSCTLGGFGDQKRQEMAKLGDLLFFN